MIMQKIGEHIYMHEDKICPGSIRKMIVIVLQIAEKIDAPNMYCPFKNKIKIKIKIQGLQTVRLEKMCRVQVTQFLSERNFADP